MVKLRFEGGALVGWVGGQTMSGVLVVSVKTPVVTRSITVKLYGREKVCVEVSKTEVGLGATGHISAKRKTTRYKNKQILINRFCRILGAKLGQVNACAITLIQFTSIFCRPQVLKKCS